VLGTAFVAIMFAATATVAIWERWDGLLVAGAVAALAQALALVLRDEYRGESPTRVVALAAVFSAITVAAGIARQLRERAPGVRLGRRGRRPRLACHPDPGASVSALLGRLSRRGARARARDRRSAEPCVQSARDVGRRSARAGRDSCRGRPRREVRRARGRLR